jgi:hypothetical protein
VRGRPGRDCAARRSLRRRMPPLAYELFCAQPQTTPFEALGLFAVADTVAFCAILKQLRYTTEFCPRNHGALSGGSCQTRLRRGAALALLGF